MRRGTILDRRIQYEWGVGLERKWADRPIFDDPVAAAEADDEWLWLDSLENPQLVDEYDLDDMAPPIEAYEEPAGRIVMGRAA